MLLYNGDLDTVCDFFADEAAIETMNLTVTYFKMI